MINAEPSNLIAVNENEGKISITANPLMFNIISKLR